MRLRVSAVLFAGFGAVALLTACDSNDSTANQPPTVTVPTLTATEDTPLTAQVSATDPEGKPITLALVSNAQHGTATVSSAGQISYTPAANYSGPDTFTISATDEKGASANAVVNVNVTPVNDAPVFTSATTLGINEDVTGALQLTATDADGNALSYSLVSSVQHGIITVAASGAVSYTPAPNYAGTDSFSARVSDGVGGTANSTVAITISAVNDAPILTSTAIQTSEDNHLAGTLTFLDPDSSNVTVSLAGGAAHGQLTVSAAGAYQYIPDTNYFGVDNATIALSDGTVTVNWPLTINVLPINDPPVLTSLALVTDEDTTLTTQLTATDADGNTVDFAFWPVTGLPTHGTATLSMSGQLQYTPNANFSGSDRITVVVRDGLTGFASENVMITVNSVNDVPVAADDEFRIATGAPMTLNVTSNDTDVEGALTVSIVQQPAGGTVTVGANNLLTFAPTNDFAGPITFTYRATDSGGAHDDATVRALIGDFQGLVYLGDDLLTGRDELYLFDGLNSTRIVQAPANNFEFITRFTLSADGTGLMYVIAGPLIDTVYFKRIGTPGNGTQIFQNPPVSPPPNAASLVFSLNHSGSYALVEDRYSSAQKRIHVVNTATGAAALLGGNEPQVVRASLALFNPQDGNQVVLQGQIGGTVPTNGAEYYSAFIASVLTPADLTQIGADYPQAQGSGSGYGFWFGGAGRYIYHTEGLMTPAPSTRSLLLWDNDTQSETVVYRRPIGTERGLGHLAYQNADGSKVCYSFTEPNPTSQSGPAAYYFSGHAMPAAATPISPVYADTGICAFASDGDTAVLQPVSASGNRHELFSVDTSLPGTPVQLSHALAAGESLGAWWVASDAPRAIIGYRFPPATATSLYSIPVAGGTELQFATDYEDTAMGAIDDNGLLLAYVPVENNRRVLRVRSTQAPGYLWNVSNPASTRSVFQFRWLPQP